MIDKLPNDIVIIIYEFDGTKRETIEKCLYSIKRNACIHKFRKLKYKLPFRTTDTDDLIYIFYTLSKCQCCSQHMHNRPHYLSPQLVYFEDEFRSIICRCPCRHICRYINRRFYPTTLDIQRTNINV